MKLNFIKSIVAILFLAMYLFSTSSTFLTYLSYNYNKTYVQEVLCVNKSKKNQQCYGKCFIKKELLKQDAGDELTITKNLNISPHLITDLLLSHLLIGKDIMNTSFINNHKTQYLFITTPPPEYALFQFSFKLT